MDTPYIVPPCPSEIEILYRDEHLLVINKPEFLLSIPGRHPANQDCVINRLRPEYPGAKIVHRLDLDTSGLMIIPLGHEVHATLSRQFQERQVEKAYHAVVHDLVRPDQGEISLPIAPDWQRRPRQKICHERGKSALTRFKVLTRDRSDNSTRLLLTPLTGRSHQLRIHLSEIGHPILGCDLYAHNEALRRSSRLLLHASRIAFQHPVSGKILITESQPEF